MQTRPDGQQNPPARNPRRWWLLATVSLGLFMITIDNSVLYTALPTLTQELHASALESLWIVNAYPLAIAGLLMGTGTLGDRVGHRRMFTLGLVVFGLASLLAAFAPAPAVLITARAFLGIGGAMMMPATLALISRTFDIERERNLAIAIWGAVSLVGAAAGPVLGGLLLEHFWWGSVFLVNVPITVLALLAVPLVAGPNLTHPEKPWDFASSALAALTLVGLVFFIKELARTDPHWFLALLALAVGAGAAWAFTARQRRLTYPLLDFTIFRNPVFLAGVLAAALTMFAIAGIDLVAVQRFQLVAGFSPLEAGLLVTVLAVSSLPFSVLGGAILHRVGYFPLISGGLAIAAVGAGLLAASIHHTFTAVVLGLVVLGVGLGLTMSVASSAIIGNAPASRAGMASSVEEVSYEFGSLLSVALLGSLINLVYANRVQLPAGTPPEAAEALSSAVAAAGSDSAVLDPAFAAYDVSFTVVVGLAAVVLALTALVTGVLLIRGARARARTGSGEERTRERGASAVVGS
ncbi:MFS transporter [Brevibacterium samyangense]|uniref:MFS transporter n=1 Tax=Brevibacterium samyangense TaxID=366888 RepID=A0ABN2T9C9_9MICO